ALRNSGQDEEAIAAFSRSLEIDANYRSAQSALDGVRRLTALEARLPSALEDETLANNDFLALAAALQRWKGRYLESAEIYRHVFAREPSLAANFRNDYRYNAACAAACAGAGLDRRTPLAESDRQKWREQAMQWLTDDLGAIEAWIEPNRL